MTTVFVVCHLDGRYVQVYSDVRAANRFISDTGRRGLGGYDEYVIHTCPMWSSADLAIGDQVHEIVDRRSSPRWDVDPRD